MVLSDLLFCFESATPRYTISGASCKEVRLISGTFYTLTEVAHLLEKDRHTIARWLKQGKISGERVGNMVLIGKEEVDKLRSKAALTLG